MSHNLHRTKWGAVQGMVELTHERLLVVGSDG